jgi:hypothetical protein
MFRAPTSECRPRYIDSQARDYPVGDSGVARSTGTPGAAKRHALENRHHTLPGWDAAAERRDAQDGLHSAAQARAWADGDFDADHGFAFDGVGRPAHQSRARGPIGAGAADVRAPLPCV